MKTVNCKTKEDAIEKLENWINSTWNDVSEESNKRLWMKSSPKDSYDDPTNKVELWTLEGSPVKQIALVNHYFKYIDLMNGRGKLEKRFSWNEKIELMGRI